jgi:multimeric flavodoxin WrbA
MTTPRKGQAPDYLPRDEFARRFRQAFYDPAFDAERDALDRIEKIAWGAYKGERKAPRTEKAGPGFKDPKYDLSVEWAETRRRLRAAEAVQRSATSPSRVLVICGSARNDGSCPGEVSKTWRLSKLAIEVLERAKVEADLLDLSQLTSEYGKRIFPCKACVSTAQPLCHWPCSCYPNHALGQVGDWMNDIYERWVAAHAVILLTPVNWYHSSSPVKLMIDRLVCADGGNPDPTTTKGKDAKLAKKIELAGWDYPKHLAGRAYGIVVHGDVAGTDDARKALSDWLDWMGLIDAGNAARLDRYIGYYEPYATSHESLDDDKAVQEEVRNVARAVVNAVHQLREGRLKRLDEGLQRPRPK